MNGTTHHFGRSACINFAAVALFALVAPAAVLAQEKAEEIKVSSDSQLGLFWVTANAPLAHDMEVPVRTNIIIGVIKGGAADKAGLRTADAILSANIGKDFGSKASLRIQRKGEAFDVEFTTRKHDLSASYDLVELPKRTKPVTIRVDSSIPNYYHSLTGALLIAAPGDTVLAVDGVYREQVLIPSGVTLGAVNDGGAVIQSAMPVRVFGARDVRVRGLHLVGGRFGAAIEWARDVSLQNCTVESEEIAGINVYGVRNMLVGKCSVSGRKEKTNGIRLTMSQGRVEESSFFGNKWGIYIQKESDVLVAQNLLDDNNEGVSAVDSVLTVRQNMITGNGQFSGIVATRSTMDADSNTIRQHRFGITSHQAKGTIRGNTVSQNVTGIMADSGDLKITDNLVLQNQNYGINLYGAVADVPANAARKAVVTGNTVAGNEWVGIWSEQFQAEIDHNLLELNGGGIRTEKADVKIHHNTVALQKGFGILVGRDVTAEVNRNIVAFNYYGMFVDVASRTKSDHNLVYGNLPRTELPLQDGNYVRRDRLPTRGGEKFFIRVLPALELKTDTDINADPKFVAKGRDYRLRSDSPAVKGNDTIGAFPVKKD
jgi:parallel beta helix pectate lyase-like protein